MSDKAQRRIIVLLTIAMALVYLAGTSFSSGISKPIVQGDARSYFAYLPSVVFDGDLDLSNQFAELRPEAGDPRYPFGSGADGYAANPFPIGPALLWLPGYLVGLSADYLAKQVGIDTGPFGYGLFAAWGAALMAIFLAGVGAELSRRTVREFVGLEYALPAALAAWLGTPALYYTVVAPLYSHAVALFAAAATLWLSWLASQRPGDHWRWAVAGVAGGLLTAIRLQDAPVVLVAAALLVWSVDQAQRPKAFAALFGGGFIGYLPQAYTWFALHGEVIPSQNLGNPQALSLSSLTSVLFSVGYEGWLTWTPLAAIAIWGLFLIAIGPFHQTQRAAAGAALLATATLVIIDSIHPYGQGAAFGARRYVTLTPFLALGGGAAIAWLGARRRFARSGLILVGALVLANLWLFTAYELLVMRRGVYGSLATTWRYALGLSGG